MVRAIFAGHTRSLTIDQRAIHSQHVPVNTDAVRTPRERRAGREERDTPRQLPITLLPTRHLFWLLFSEHPVFPSIRYCCGHPLVLLVQMLVHLQYTVNILTARPITHGRLFLFAAYFGGRTVWKSVQVAALPPARHKHHMSDVCLVTTKHNGSQTPTNLQHGE